MESWNLVVMFNIHWRWVYNKIICLPSTFGEKYRISLISNYCDFSKTMRHRTLKLSEIVEHMHSNIWFKNCNFIFNILESMIVLLCKCLWRCRESNSGRWNYSQSALPFDYRGIRYQRAVGSITCLGFSRPSLFAEFRYFSVRINRRKSRNTHY